MDADLADIQFISNFNTVFRFLLYIIIDVYNKYAWLVPLKDKKGIAITKVDKETEFYNRSMKPWVQEKEMKVYSTHKKEKAIVAGLST